MSRGKDFRETRRRGFDDDNFSTRSDSGSGSGSGFQMPRHFGGPPRPTATGPVVDAVVKWFNPEKGFGFVELADGTGDAFLHIAVLEAAGRKSVLSGAKVKARVGQGQKGPQVTEVIDVDETTAAAQPPRRSGPLGPRPQRAAPDLSTAIEMSGTVKWYNPDKGFGFVAIGDGGKDVFVHASVLQRAGIADLAEGQRVTMQVVEGMKGREAAAISAVG